MAKAISSGNQPQAEKYQNEIGHLERELAYLFINSNKVYGDLNIGVSDVLSRVGNNLGLNFIRYGSNIDSLRYGVFLISQRLKKPLFVDLCTEKEIIEISDLEGNSYIDRLYSLIWEALGTIC